MPPLAEVENGGITGVCTVLGLRWQHGGIRSHCLFGVGIKTGIKTGSKTYFLICSFVLPYLLSFGLNFCGYRMICSIYILR